MPAGLLMLYCLGIGTLLLSAGATFWEMHDRQDRSTSLGLWGSAYVIQALGCIMALARAHLPGITGWAITHLLFTTGYAGILLGVGRLDHRRYDRAALAVLATLTLAWIIGGSAIRDAMWTYLSAFVISGLNAATAWHLARRCTIDAPRARMVAGAIATAHAVFYFGRALITLPMAPAVCHGLTTQIAIATMYEGVLFSVAMPTALLALLREERHRHILHLSRTDHLTTLNNRQFFLETGQRLIRENGDDQALTVLLIDIDHFKTINDTFGHGEGDNILRLFAETLRALTPKVLLTGRLGGEEFALILKTPRIDEAYAICDTVRSRFAQLVAERVPALAGASISGGLAPVRTAQDLIDGVILEADRALYRAKALGRNRIIIATAPDTPAEIVPLACRTG